MRRTAACAMLGVLAMTHMTLSNLKAETSSPIEAAAKSANSFAIDLYSQAGTGEGNICISPYSVSSALGMATAGADGKTRDQMLQVLDWTGQPGEFPAASSSLTSELTAIHGAWSPDNGQPTITIANALFGQKGYPYKQPFLDVLNKQYSAPLQEVDFTANAAGACEQINSWAATQTHDKIKNAVPASAITPATRLILVDAIYFKANWADEFNKGATQDQPFYLTGKEPVNVPLMHAKSSYNYLETDSMQAVELPFRGDYSMVILLPKQRDGLAALEKSLSRESMSAWMGKLAPQLTQLFVPRFTMEGSYEFSGTLAKMGMPDAFTPAADFSQMTSAEKFCIDQVIHKTFIAVDEAGTEAAAITAITMRATAMRPVTDPPKPVVFRADHPFLFVLRHRETGTILFMGRIENPK